MRSTSASLRLALSASAIALSAFAAPQAASAATCTWGGGNDLWTNVVKWSCGAQPSSADNVFISAGGSVVNMNGIFGNAGTLSLSSATALNLNSGFLTIFGGAVTNNGVITIANASRLQSGAGAGTSLVYGGTGTIVLDNSVNYAQLGGGYAITALGAGQTIRGSGQVGFDQTTIINNGLISADAGTGISLDGYGGSGGVGGIYGAGVDGISTFVNNGTIQATNGKLLAFESGRFDNTNGVIRAINGGTVTLDADARIIGGMLTTDATSAITANGTNEYLQGVTLSNGSKLNLDSDFIYVNGSLTNNGTITIANASRLSSETTAGSVLTYSGNGTIVLDNSANYAQLGGNYAQTVIGNGQVVRGSGQVGFDQTTIINNGLISADAGIGISLDGYGGNGGVGAPYGAGADGISTFVNNGTMQAINGKLLAFESGRFDNINGLIQAINGGTVILDSDARIIGGNLSSDATSFITANGTNEYLQGVTLTGGSRINLDNDYIYINGALTNNGTITIANASRLSSETGAGSTTTYSGNGAIVLDNSVNYAQLGGNYAQTVIGGNLTVRGSGQVGFDQSTIINNGLISADSGTGISLDGYAGNGGVGAPYGAGIDGLSTFVNNGTVQATGVGHLLAFESGRYDNTNGVIRAINGGTVVLDGDARIIGGTLSSDATSFITANGTNEYLQGITLTGGSRINLDNDYIYVNGGLTNNGTITIANASRLISETTAGSVLTYSGTGTIVLDNSVGYAQLGGNYAQTVIGSGQVVRGSGQVGFNESTIINNGLISADAGTGISLDGYAGSGGIGSPYGVGSDGITTFVNNGTIQANGSTLAFESGRYQNNAGATIAARTGSTVLMNGDANLTNLQTGGVLNLGNYVSLTTGAASTLNLRGLGANSISTIGTGAAGQDTAVTLSGVNSVFNVTNFGTGVNTTLDSSLTTVAHSGALQLLNNRSMTIVAGGGAFSNAGLVQLGGGTFGASSFTNSGAVDGFGTVAVNIANTGSVTATGGTLATRTITGANGTVMSNAGAIIDISGGASNSTAGSLVINGGLGLGTRNITVTSDYANAAFGSGNAFNNHANVTGSGLILAANATMDLSGSALSGNVLNVGNVRTGGSSSTTLTITNNGTLTDLVGAVKNTNAPSIALTGADWTASALGGSANVGISYTGLSAGSLAGQTLSVVNNFDNVAAQTITLQGNIYQAAQAGSLPASITLGARRVGDAAATSALTIANVAPVTPGFNEALTANASVGGGFQLNGAGSASIANLAAGSSAPITLSHLSNVAGAFSDTVNVSNTSIAVAGSGLSNLALAGQSINVISNIYATAVANLANNSVNFGTARQGAASPTGNVGIANGAVGGLTDSLVTSYSGLPAGVTATAPGALAAGQSGNATFALNTSTAGVVSGSGSLNFVSHDSELADVALASQSVSFSGIVTELSVAQLFLNSGSGTFAGGGSSYTLSLGTFAANSGIYTDDIGVANAIANNFFAETLGGSFAQGAATGYSFVGNTFSGLGGGSSNLGNLLSFDTTGLTSGTYTKSITFNGYSRYAGLNDYSLTPITLNISANVSGGGVGAVPEPASWTMMIFGFGLIGSMVRRKKSNLAYATRA